MLQNIENIILTLLFLGIIPYTYITIVSLIKDRNSAGLDRDLAETEMRKKWLDMIEDINEDTSTRK